jgi:CRISPR/Cas system-associated exonuclease Cas4 (RecB family)
MSDSPHADPRAFPEPHLSHSRITKYLTCPEQYRLYYVEGLRSRVPSASLVFGSVVHSAMAQFFSGQADAVTWFMQEWDSVLGLALTYKPRETWETLRSAGHILLSRFLREELPRLGEVRAVEQPFVLSITDLDMPFVGVIDLVADVNGRRTVIDYKTSSSGYGIHEVNLSDQLTAYHLAEPEASQSAIWVLIKTKEPRIEWHPTGRTPAQLTEYLRKVRLVAGEIGDGKFYKRPGIWCTWCDYLPVCLGDQRKTEETLVNIKKANE